MTTQTKALAISLAAALPLALTAPAFACDKTDQAKLQNASSVTYMAMLPTEVASSTATPPETELKTEKDDAESTEDALTTTPNSDVAGEVEIFEPGLDAYGTPLESTEPGEFTVDGELDTADDDAETDYSTGEGEDTELEAADNKDEDEASDMVDEDPLD